MLRLSDEAALLVQESVTEAFAAQSLLSEDRERGGIGIQYMLCCLASTWLSTWVLRPLLLQIFTWLDGREIKTEAESRGGDEGLGLENTRPSRVGHTRVF